MKKSSKKKTGQPSKQKGCGCGNSSSKIQAPKQNRVNAWQVYLASYRSSHGNCSLKEAMMLASKSYREQVSYRSGGTPKQTGRKRTFSSYGTPPPKRRTLQKREPDFGSSLTVNGTQIEGMATRRSNVKKFRSAPLSRDFLDEALGQETLTVHTGIREYVLTRTRPASNTYVSGSFIARVLDDIIVFEHRLS